MGLGCSLVLSSPPLHHCSAKAFSGVHLLNSTQSNRAYSKICVFLFVHLQLGLCNWWITSGPSVQYLGVKLQNLLWLLTYVCECVSTSQCFNKLTRDATEAAKVELLSPEMACHRWNERNTGGMPKPQESLCCLWVGRVYLCVFVRIFPSPIFSSALSPLEEAIFNQRCRERHFTSLPIKFHHQERHHFYKWCLVFVELYLPQWPEKAVKVVLFSKVFTSVEGNWGSVHLNCSLGVNEWDDTVDTLGDKSCFSVMITKARSKFACRHVQKKWTTLTQRLLSPVSQWFVVFLYNSVS